MKVKTIKRRNWVVEFKVNFPFYGKELVKGPSF